MRKNGRPPPDWFAELKSLPRKETYSTAELAERFSRKPVTINQVLQRHELKPRREVVGNNVMNFWEYEDLVSLSDQMTP